MTMRARFEALLAPYRSNPCRDTAAPLVEYADTTAMHFTPDELDILAGARLRLWPGTMQPDPTILQAERDGAIARLAVAEADRDHWKRRAIQAEMLERHRDDLKNLLTEMLQEIEKY